MPYPEEIRSALGGAVFASTGDSEVDVIISDRFLSPTVESFVDGDRVPALGEEETRVHHHVEEHDDTKQELTLVIVLPHIISR
jgi:hypothetical protein